MGADRWKCINMCFGRSADHVERGKQRALPAHRLERAFLYFGLPGRMFRTMFALNALLFAALSGLAAGGSCFFGAGSFGCDCAALIESQWAGMGDWCAVGTRSCEWSPFR